MGGDLGLVHFKNVTVASCKQHGISFERIVGVGKDENMVDGAVLVGSSALIGGSTSVGMVGPQSDEWLVRNARFYRFTDGAGGIGQCTHCLTPKADGGARTYRFRNLHWDDATVTKRVKYLGPYKGILHDLDGTLTGRGANTYATSYWKHNDQPECTLDEEMYSGLICSSSVAVRRLVFTGADKNINRKTMYIWQYDDSITGGSRILRNLDTAFDKETYLTYETASELKWVERGRPKYHWTIPYVTGHKYYIRWLHGIDF